MKPDKPKRAHCLICHIQRSTHARMIRWAGGPRKIGRMLDEIDWANLAGRKLGEIAPEVPEPPHDPDTPPVTGYE
jgi:hypothetical protein